MENLYFYSVVIGGTLMVGQFLLSLLGLHDDVDLHDFHDLPESDIDGAAVDSDHGGGGWFVGIFSFRAIVSALTVFGLVGLGASKQFSDSSMTAFIIAIVAGFGVLYLTGWAIHAMYQIRSDGTVHMEEAVGENGTVYLKIPGQKSGVGKVSVVTQDRSMVYKAMTADDEISTGTPVFILGVLSPGVLEVTSVVHHKTRQ
jgi:hypothetical protein